MSALNSNAKDTALRIMKRFHDPYDCWTHLKSRYKADNNPRKVYLINRFFSVKKINTISINEYLTDMKETADSLEDDNVPLPEPVIVWYTVKNTSGRSMTSRNKWFLATNFRPLQIWRWDYSEIEDKESEALFTFWNDTRRSSPDNNISSSFSRSSPGTRSYIGPYHQSGLESECPTFRRHFNTNNHSHSISFQNTRTTPYWHNFN